MLIWRCFINFRRPRIEENVIIDHLVWPSLISAFDETLLDNAVLSQSIPHILLTYGRTVFRFQLP